MKNFLKYSVVLVLMVLSFSCEKRLGDLNRNKIDPTLVDPVSLLNNAIINISFPTRSVQFDVGIVQQMVTPNGGVLAGANFNQDSRDQPGLWLSYYENVTPLKKVYKPQDFEWVLLQVLPPVLSQSGSHDIYWL